MEPISFNTGDSRTGLHAIGRIFGQAAVDVFLGRRVILVVRQESGSTPVLILKDVAADIFGVILLKGFQSERSQFTHLNQNAFRPG